MHGGPREDVVPVHKSVGIGKIAVGSGRTNAGAAIFVFGRPNARDFRPRLAKHKLVPFFGAGVSASSLD